MKLLLMQSSPVSRHFLSLRSKYSHNPILKHPMYSLVNITSLNKPLLVYGRRGEEKGQNNNAATELASVNWESMDLGHLP
jgi:hypothetical protein